MQTTSNITIGGENRNIADNTARQLANRIYEGVNLEELHAAEINESFGGNPWAWIQARIHAGNYRGINVGDSIAFQRQLNNQNVTQRAVVLGIDTYRPFGGFGRCIDFMFQMTDQGVPWNLVANNNGIMPEQSDGFNRIPWMVSNLRAWLNGLQQWTPNSATAQGESVQVDYRGAGIIDSLSPELVNVVAPKLLRLSDRATAGLLLSENNGFRMSGEASLGRLWIPTEVEVIGHPVVGSSFDTGNQRQYPFFLNNRRRISMVRSLMWLLTSASGTTSGIAAFESSSNNGGVRVVPANTANIPGSFQMGFMVCFRVQ